jgi:hypothetical protein
MDASDLTNQILLLFFPAAFASEGQCSNQLLSRINRQYMAFRSLNTEYAKRTVHACKVLTRSRRVYGVGHELPFSLKALKAKLQLQFTLLSDPSRSLCVPVPPRLCSFTRTRSSSHCVGTMDFGKYLIQSSGIHMPHLRGYRTSNAGLVQILACLSVYVSIYSTTPANMGGGTVASQREPYCNDEVDVREE